MRLVVRCVPHWSWTLHHSDPYYPHVQPTSGEAHTAAVGGMDIVAVEGLSCIVAAAVADHSKYSAVVMRGHIGSSPYHRACLGVAVAIRVFGWWASREYRRQAAVAGTLLAGLA